MTEPTITDEDKKVAARIMQAYLDDHEKEAHRLAAEHRELGAQEARYELVNTPETADFITGVALEAIHQRERWPSDHDKGKSPFDWFWLIGYLAQKAADSAVAGDVEKAKHHTISTAAALANWHAALSGADTRMRPGIAAPRHKGKLT
jgi:hypothetical protein